MNPHAGLPGVVRAGIFPGSLQHVSPGEARRPECVRQAWTTSPGLVSPLGRRVEALTLTEGSKTQREALVKICMYELQYK